MLRRPRRRLVRVAAAGAALSVNGLACGFVQDGLGLGEEITRNPPPPLDTASIGTNPPAQLPTWDEVASGHPEGATNPPTPVLVVTQDGTDCFKAWEGARTPDPESSRLGGRVVADAGQAGGATPIVCPDDAAEVLRKWKLDAAQDPPKP